MSNIHHISSDYLANRGIGHNSIMKVFPGLHSKRLEQMNRTSFKVFSGDTYNRKSLSGDIEIPSYKKEDFELNFDLHEFKWGGIYKVTSKSYFKFNNAITKESFIVDGSELTIGLVKIKFLNANQVVSSFESEDYCFNQLCDTQLPIYIEGETGTGKSYLARKIHQHSNRNGKFVHINLSSFSDSLIESELFGHEKGAFTGAFRRKLGAILEAKNGTLFIDEIDSISKSLQTKLLLFLDNYKVRPVGGNFESKVQTNIIIASGSPLKKLVDEGSFRKDLYFRLTSGHVLFLKNLREDRSKITHFLENFERENNIFIAKELKRLYSEYHWPGNYRQLNSHLKLKKEVSKSSYIDFSREDHRILGKFEKIDDNVIPLKCLKQKYVQSVFIKSGYSTKQTASLLKVTPNTVRSLLRNYPAMIE